MDMGLFRPPDTQDSAKRVYPHVWIILQMRAHGKLAFTRLARTVALNLDPWYNLTLDQAEG